MPLCAKRTKRKMMCVWPHPKACAGLEESWVRIFWTEYRHRLLATCSNANTLISSSDLQNVPLIAVHQSARRHIKILRSSLQLLLWEAQSPRLFPHSLFTVSKYFSVFNVRKNSVIFLGIKLNVFLSSSACHPGKSGTHFTDCICIFFFCAGV
jgi:hypothetical protein